MGKSSTPRCQGRRRMQRGPNFGLYRCGRKATAIITLSVGHSSTRYVCDDSECFGHLTSGYPANSRPLTKV